MVHFVKPIFFAGTCFAVNPCRESIRPNVQMIKSGMNRLKVGGRSLFIIKNCLRKIYR